MVADFHDRSPNFRQAPRHNRHGPDRLARLLAEKKIAGAGLDVYEREPAIEPGLLKLDNVVLAPHLGSATHEGRIAMGEKVIVNIRSFVDRHNPPDRVYEV